MDTSQENIFSVTRNNSNLSLAGLLKEGTAISKFAQSCNQLTRSIAGAYNYKIVRKEIIFPKLPKRFDGLRIVHISDIHAGNLKNRDAVYKGIQMINAERADLVFFTGDMISHNPFEIYKFIDVFSHMKSKLGIYAVMGNHDYGDYSDHSRNDRTISTTHILEAAYKQLKWKLLNNENCIIERKKEKIAILGTENWSAAKRFPRYGSIKKASKGTEDIEFKMLLTHDPSHWEKKVAGKKDIQLTFSGHTHGFQFGLGTKDYKWSPAKYFHKHWKGLYRENNQYLYVNPGFGVIGMPGRIGMPPEITVLQLSSS